MKTRPRKTGKTEYPDETSGSRLAARVRGLSNHLSEEERRAHLDAAMLLIYGGSQPKKATRG